MYSKRLRVELLWAFGYITTARPPPLPNNLLFPRVAVQSVIIRVWGIPISCGAGCLEHLDSRIRHEFNHMYQLDDEEDSKTEINLTCSSGQNKEEKQLFCMKKKDLSAPNFIFTKTRGSTLFVATETESYHLLLLYCLVWQNNLTSEILSVN